MLGDMVRRLIFSRWGHGSKPSFNRDMVQMKLIKSGDKCIVELNLIDHHMNSWQVVSHWEAMGQIPFISFLPYISLHPAILQDFTGNKSS